MRNFVQPGGTLTLPAPYARKSGEAAKIGSIFGVASTDVAQDAEGEFVTEGVFDLAKVGSQAWAVGAKVYWDDAAKNLTVTAASNQIVGVAVVPVGNGANETVGRIKLGLVA